jgi:riboflavin kinase
MTEYLWFTLLALARMGGASSSVHTSTPRLATLLGISQQTASRRLHALEKKGWIRRTMNSYGQIIRIKPKGIAQLKEVYSMLEIALTEKRSVSIRGRVTTGLGEGAYYIQLEGYKRQFRKKLGYIPFPGTLNVQLISEADVHELQLLKASVGIEIHGFATGDRTFGSVACYPTRVNDLVDAAILLIQRTHHKLNVIEIIAPVNLREKLKLEDGDIITLKTRVQK